MLKIIPRRLEGKAETYQGNDQFGFRKGQGTRDGIAAVRTLAERPWNITKSFKYVIWIMKNLSTE